MFQLITSPIRGVAYVRQRKDRVPPHLPLQNKNSSYVWNSFFFRMFWSQSSSMKLNRNSFETAITKCPATCSRSALW